jgi:hypothetical protein
MRLFPSWAASSVMPSLRKSLQLASPRINSRRRDRALRDHKAHDSGPPLEPGSFSHAVEILERLHGGGILGEGGSILQ